MSNHTARIQFTPPLHETNPKEPLNFSRNDDLAPLDQVISWEYVSEKGETTPPKHIIKRILNYDKEYNLPKNGEELREKFLRTEKTQLTIKELLLSEDEDIQIPLGGSYRLVLEAVWETGKKSSATTYFSLPDPELYLLGNSRNPESEKAPRIIEKGDHIRIANWMHGWENFEYDLEIEEKVGGSWEYIDPYDEKSPLTIESRKNGVIITVAKKPKNLIRYRVVFLPNERTGLSEIIDPEDVSTEYGYIKSRRLPITPFIFVGCILLALSFFLFNFFRKK